MSFGAAPFVFVFVNMVVIGCTDADQQKPSSFLSSYDSYKNICSKIGWEPKCRKPPYSDCQGKVIAFHAFLSTRLSKLPSGTIIKFGRVLVNEGNGYDPNTGKFTAPVDGVYSCSWTYHTNKGSIAYLGGFVDGTLTARIGNYLQTKA
ncbi:uncharacterized protein LOC111110026 [Crassostrea virginica]